MERVAAKPTGPMILAPLADGWKIQRGPDLIAQSASLQDLAKTLPPDGLIELHVPTHLLVIERLRLPSTKRTELAGMVQLQWEKALPFSVDELTGEFMVIESTDRESVLLTAAISTAALDQLRSAFGRHAPRITRVTASIEQFAGISANPGTTALVTIEEDRHLVLVAARNGRPAWVHVLSSPAAEDFAGTLPQILLTAGMEGIDTNFTQILVEKDSADLAATLQEFFELPVTIFERSQATAKPTLNLLPRAWLTESRRRTSRARLTRRLYLAAALYLFVALLTAIYLLVLKSKTAQLDEELAAVQPQLELLQSYQAQSLALAPAIDPQRYTVEVLYCLHRLLPAGDVRLTEFDHNPHQWRLVGEAPSASDAIEYLNRIKSDPDLQAYAISANPPRLLANGKAQFNIFGKQ